MTPSQEELVERVAEQTHEQFRVWWARLPKRYKAVMKEPRPWAELKDKPDDYGMPVKEAYRFVARALLKAGLLQSGGKVRLPRTSAQGGGWYEVKKIER